MNSNKYEYKGNYNYFKCFVERKLPLTYAKIMCTFNRKTIGLLRHQSRVILFGMLKSVRMPGTPPLWLTGVVCRCCCRLS